MQSYGAVKYKHRFHKITTPLLHQQQQPHARAHACNEPCTLAPLNIVFVCKCEYTQHHNASQQKTHTYAPEHTRVFCAKKKNKYTKPLPLHSCTNAHTMHHTACTR